SYPHLFLYITSPLLHSHSFPTRRSSDLALVQALQLKRSFWSSVGLTITTYKWQNNLLFRYPCGNRWAPLFSNRALQAGFTGILTDRKSTRLNSSHQIISYAVFCLKKKNL